MQPLERQSLVEITAAHLRDGFRAGRWSGKLPGVGRLADDLAISKETVRAALHLLEMEGLLKQQGAGRSRQIVASPLDRPVTTRILRVAVLLPKILEEDNSHSQSLILRLVRAIEHAGHECFMADKSLAQMGNRLDSLARLVQATAADAWIIYDASHAVLDWFHRRLVPAMALGGRIIHLPLACTRADLTGAMNGAVDTLVAHGHRRIVTLAPHTWLRPELNPAAGAFSRRMAHHGLPASSYNLPEWEDSARGLQDLLHSLFQRTPPTALLMVEPAWTVGTFVFLSRRGLRVPEDVSLIALMPDPVLALWEPPLAHFDWQFTPHIRHIVRWAQAVAKGSAATEIKNVPCTFELGGTIGPARTIQTKPGS